jgi:hypothetical protein
MAALRVLQLLLLVHVLLITASCNLHKKSVTHKKYSPSELQEDAGILSNVLLEMHPSVGLYEPAEHYRKTFSDFTNSLTDSLTEKEFRLKTKLLIDDLHCGHTEVLYSNRYYRRSARTKVNYSPYIFIPVRDRLFVIGNLIKKRDSTLRKGTEILSINGIPVDSMIRYCKRFITTDGFNHSGKNHYVQLGFNSYFVGLFGRPDTFKVVYREGKIEREHAYEAVKLKNLPALPLGPRDDSLFRRYRRARIKYRFMDEDKKSMFLKIERFSHKSDFITYRKIFRKLHKNKSENLVIDLRNNGGGSLANSYRLLSYLLDKKAPQTLRTTIRNYPYKKYTRGNLGFKLTRLAYNIIGTKKSVNDTDHFSYIIKPRKKYHFDKNVYVLINGGSFSASCLVAAYLKGEKRAVFIGEETGGAQEGCNAGITPFYKLPNTRVRVRVPAFRIVHDVLPELTGRGVIPDHEIAYSLKDIFYKRDLELNKVKALLGMPGNP